MSKFYPNFFTKHNELLTPIYKFIKDSTYSAIYLLCICLFIFCLYKSISIERNNETSLEKVLYWMLIFLTGSLMFYFVFGFGAWLYFKFKK